MQIGKSKGRLVMSKRNYPTRMHEVLGVETEERFTHGDYGNREFWLSESGLLYGAYDDGKGFVGGPSTQGTLVRFINNPERITRRPRLTEEQREQLRAIWTLGGRWLAKDESGNVFAYDSKPQKIIICCHWNNDDGKFFTVNRELSVCSIVTWSDPEPLDIVQVLRENGCEIGEVEG